MSKHPTERHRTVAELQATSMQQSDKALRRIASAEERLARLEDRLAQKDQTIARHEDTITKLSDAVTAMSAVVAELDGKLGKGVDQVVTNMESRLRKVETETPVAHRELRELIQANRDGIKCLDDSCDLIHESFEQRLGALETKPKRGRPRGSKNKPKSTPIVELAEATEAENAPSDIPEVESQ